MVSAGRGSQRQQGHGDQHRSAAKAVGQRPAHRQPEEVGNRHQQRDQQAVRGAEHQHLFTKGRGIDGDQVERGGGHRHHHHPGDNHLPVRQQGGEYRASPDDGGGQ